jgi:hypothetical protein
LKANQLNDFDSPLIQTEFENIYNILNKIGLADSTRDTTGQRAENVDMYLVDVTASSVASDDNSVSHNLLKTPLFYSILTQSGSGDFYEGSGTNSESLFFIKCTTENTRFTIGLW